MVFERIGFRPLDEHYRANMHVLLRKASTSEERLIARKLFTPNGNIFRISDKNSRIMETSDENLWVDKLARIAVKIDAAHQLFVPPKIPKMITIPGGRFFMGSNRSEYEKPVREVTLSTFDVSVDRISYGEHLAFLDDINQLTSGFPADTRAYLHPVTFVSWKDTMSIEEDSLSYCEWLTNSTGDKHELLTEAQFEYVAKNAHRFGIKDLPGHIMVWVKDFYQNGYNPADVINPQGPKKGDLHIVRGGHLGITGRAGYPPDYRKEDIGFYVVRYRSK